MAWVSCVWRWGGEIRLGEGRGIGDGMGGWDGSGIGDRGWK